MTIVLWLLPPMAVGLLVLTTHISLGRQVLKRGIVFIDLAIAQAAALGVLAGEGLGFGGAATLLFSGGFAIAGAALVAWLSRAWPARREALIGLIYVGAASMTIFWVSSDALGAQRLSSLLGGDILWTTWASMLPLFVVSLVYNGLLCFQPDSMNRDLLFYPGFAVLVSLSVPLLGLYLVFVCLIVPALWNERTNSALLASAVSTVAFIVGVLLSFWFDWPTGTTVAIVMVASALPLTLINNIQFLQLLKAPTR